MRLWDLVASGVVCWSSFSSSSFSSCMSSMDSMGTRCWRWVKPSSGAPPTRWVGESGAMRWGCWASSFLSSSRRVSNSASAISGAASW